MRRLVVIVAVFALVWVAGGSAAEPGGRASADREAKRLLGAYRPPQGAVRIKAVPRGDHLPGAGTGGIVGERVVRHRLWLVHLPVKAFVGYFFHRLSRWHAISYSSVHGCTCRDSLTSTSVTYAKVGFGGRATGRVLTVVAAKSHRAGWSVLRADLVLVWRLSAAEREDLPAGVSEVDIRGPGGKASVTNRDRVNTIVRWFDQSQIYEAPFAGLSCGVKEQPSLTFTFRARHGTIAKASVPEHSSGCSAATYTIRGRTQNPLLAGEVDHRVQDLLGVKLLR